MPQHNLYMTQTREPQHQISWRLLSLAFLLEETARKILPEAVLTCCAASRAAAKAMRDYSLIRATNHGLLLNAAHAPPVVPTPALHAASHQ